MITNYFISRKGLVNVVTLDMSSTQSRRSLPSVCRSAFLTLSMASNVVDYDEGAGHSIPVSESLRSSRHTPVRELAMSSIDKLLIQGKVQV